MKCGTTVVALLLAMAPLDAQTPQASPAAPNQPPTQGGGRLLGRPSPPQPQQQRGLVYFLGTWKFVWTGRETALTPGPRQGVATISRAGNAPTATVAVEGTVDEGATYKESGSLQWDERNARITISDRLAGGAEIAGSAEWNSPIAFKVETEPMTIKGQTLRVRRTYAILSATSFSITEELSTSGGPFQRVGTGDFRKQP